MHQREKGCLCFTGACEDEGSNTAWGGRAQAHCELVLGGDLKEMELQGCNGSVRGDNLRPKAEVLERGRKFASPQIHSDPVPLVWCHGFARINR